MTLRYAVFEARAFGPVRKAAELDASSDQEALKQARRILPDGPGELREKGRVVYRFGRSDGFSLKRERD